MCGCQCSWFRVCSQGMSSIQCSCRCHPRIAAISNSQFYGGRLQDGCSEEQRGPLVKGLPALVAVDVRGSQDYSGPSHSASNRAEAHAVVQVCLPAAMPHPCAHISTGLNASPRCLALQITYSYDKMKCLKMPSTCFSPRDIASRQALRCRYAHQVVKQLLRHRPSEESTASEEQQCNSVTPEMLGVICFHRAQVCCA